MELLVSSYPSIEEWVDVSTKVNVEQWLYSLEGDVSMDRVYTIEGNAQVRDYSDGSGRLVRRDFTVAIWGHDGIDCIDVWITEDGCVGVYTDVDDEENLFMTMYTNQHATLHIDGEIPEALRESFLATATQRMEWED